MNTSPALALPELPDAVAHVHSNADFCMDRLITPHDWPAYLYTADQMATYGQQCAQAQGEAQAAEINRLRLALTNLEYVASFAGVPDKAEHRNLGIALEAARAALKSEAA